MKEKHCDEIERIFKTKYNKTFYPINYGYYLWIHRTSNDAGILIIHGKGIEGYPYEIIFLREGDESPTKREFTKWIDFKKYLNNDLMDDIMVRDL